MRTKFSSLLGMATAISAATVPAEQPATDGATCDSRQQPVAPGSACITPHSGYSSSAGVLGCKIDINRVAYWPTAVGCDDICVRVHANGNKVTLLKIGNSEGAWDISYDAWNILKTGRGALEDPVRGGGIIATWENVPMSDPKCLKPLKATDGTLPLSAANSMLYVNQCANSPGWVGKHYSLYNINDPACQWGHDERCEPPVPPNNQPTCEHTLGDPVELGSPVKDIPF